MAHPLLESYNLFFSHSIGFRNDWDQVDFSMQPLHEFDVDRFKRMSGRFNKVNEGVNPIINELVSVDAVFLFEVRVEAGFDVC